MSKKITFVILTMIIIAFVAITINNAPAKIIHPDALRFLAIYQQQFETVASTSEVPHAFIQGIKRANEYDWYRGRLTNYAAFGLEALIRSYLPFPFISWLTMAILILNATLLARLVTKNMASASGKHLLTGLAILALLMNPIFIASYEMQFIYSKYLCVTFMLLFMLSARRGFKIASLIGTMYSDEIGVAFAMIAVFLTVFNYKYKVVENERLKLSNILKSMVSGTLAAFTVLLLYYAVLKLLFQHVSTLILKGGFHSGFKLPPTILEIVIDFSSSILKALEHSIAYLGNLMSAAIGSIGIAIFVLVACAGLYKNLKNINQTYLQKQLRLSLVDKQIQEMSVAVFMVIFITWAMYRGGASLFYYSYPVYMLIMFVMLSMLVKVLSQRLAVTVLAAFVLSLIVNLPNGFALIRKEVSSVWIVDKSVSLESFDAVELAIKEAKYKDCTSKLDALNNTQDNVFLVSDTYGEKYFPGIGIVKVLAWPHKISRCS